MSNKKIILITIFAMAFLSIGAVSGIENTQNQATTSIEALLMESSILDENNSSQQTQIMKIKVNDKVLDVKLENNPATKALVEKLKEGDITINAKEYEGFEKVGNLGFSLPANDEYITTSPGDIVLYQGHLLSLFYKSNSWDYTKLGKVQNVTDNELKEILGSGDVDLVLSLK